MPESFSEDILNSNSEYYKPYSPERNLLIALINRAVLDYLGTQPRLRLAAAEWLFDENEIEETYSFAWCCSVLEISADALLERIILKRAAKDSSPVPPRANLATNFEEAQLLSSAA